MGKIFFLIMIIIILAFNICMCIKIDTQLNYLEQITTLNTNITRQHTKLIYYNQDDLIKIMEGNKKNGN